MKRGIDYIGVGVGAAIFNHQGKLFIAKRGKKAKNERGKWEIPGGSVEYGETLEEALIREIEEEHGIQIAVKELLCVYDHIIPEDNQHWVSPTFICTIISGEPIIREPEKCEAFGWFTIEEAEQLPLSLISKNNMVILKQKFPHLV